MKLLNILIVLLLSIFFIACKKDVIETKPLSSVTITNAIVGAPSLYLGSVVAPISSSSYSHYGLLAGANSIYVWPEADSAHPVFNQPVTTVEGHMYSLFLGGEMGGTVDPIWIEENFPQYTGKDAGVRFIHLAPSAPHLSIKLAGESSNQFTDVEYKEVTAFNTYTADGNPYNFEIYDNTTGTVLATYEVYPYLNRHITLAITGVNPGAPEISIVQV